GARGGDLYAYLQQDGVLPTGRRGAARSQGNAEPARQFRDCVSRVAVREHRAQVLLRDALRQPARARLQEERPAADDRRAGNVLRERTRPDRAGQGRMCTVTALLLYPAMSGAVRPRPPYYFIDVCVAPGVNVLPGIFGSAFMSEYSSRCISFPPA